MSPPNKKMWRSQDCFDSNEFSFFSKSHTCTLWKNCVKKNLEFLEIQNQLGEKNVTRFLEILVRTYLQSEITQRLRLVIMVILDVFRMGWGCAESVWVELGRYGTLVSTNHDILAQEWRIRDQISSSGKDGLAPEVPTKSRGLVLVKQMSVFGSWLNSQQIQVKSKSRKLTTQNPSQNLKNHFSWIFGCILSIFYISKSENVFFGMLVLIQKSRKWNIWNPYIVLDIRDFI